MPRLLLAYLPVVDRRHSRTVLAARDIIADADNGAFFSKKELLSFTRQSSSVKTAEVAVEIRQLKERFVD